MDLVVCLADKLVEVSALPPVERLAGLLGVQEELGVLVAVETAAFDGQAEFVGDGHRSPASFLVESCGVSGRRARGYLNVGRMLKSFPLLAAAAGAGYVSFDHLRVFARIVVSPRASEARVAAAQVSEAKFVDKASAYSCDDFAKLCKQWRSVFDDGCPEARARVREQTDVTYIEHDDDVAELRIRGPKLGVLTVRAGMTRIADSMWRKENSESDENVKPMRHNGERKFDAIVQLAKQAVAKIGLDVTLPVPLTTVQMDWDTYQREAAKYAAEATGNAADAIFDGGFVSQTQDGIPVSPGQAFAASLLGHIRRVVFGSKSAKVDLGRKQRLFTGPARDAVATRDKHCQAPGCDMPARWCDVDHITEWQHGGETNPENGQLLCRFHHTRKHKNAGEAA